MNEKQKVLLVFATEPQVEDIQELTDLVQTAGGIVVDVIVQKNEKLVSSTAIGSGKITEIKGIVAQLDVEVVIFNCELTPIMVKNLERMLECKTIDRTNLILDIFALNAHTAEGKLQVELAQLQYILPRLTGSNTQLSKLGGGIGTRGPGESKLETDRRHIKKKLLKLKTDIDKLQNIRTLQRKKREKAQMPVVAIVGYTNAGKSTLLNNLTNSNVLVENKLFATLDPTARQLKLPSGNVAILVDTVGFIKDIPHNLIAAFRSTLEEVVTADLILNVCDISSEQVNQHNLVTKKLLEDLKCTGKIVNVYNKIDRVLIEDTKSDSLYISAQNSIGIDNLLKYIDEQISQSFKKLSLFIPFTQAKLIGNIYQYGVVESINYGDAGVNVDIIINIDKANSLNQYLV